MICATFSIPDAASLPGTRPLFPGLRHGHNAPGRATRGLGGGPSSCAALFAMPTPPSPKAVLPANDRDGPEGDRRLVDAALAGDAGALQRLANLLTPVIQVRVGYALLRRRALYRGDPRARLEDLVQDTFVELFREGGRVLRAWDGSRGMSLTSFVGLVAEQRAYAFLRNRKASAKLEDLESGEDDEVGARIDARSWDPESRAATREQLRMLLDHLRAELSPAGRVLFERLLVNEEPIAKVADELKMSVSAVQAWSSRLRRRAAALAEELQNDGPQVRAQAATP